MSMLERIQANAYLELRLRKEYHMLEIQKYLFMTYGLVVGMRYIVHQMNDKPTIVDLKEISLDWSEFTNMSIDPTTLPVVLSVHFMVGGSYKSAVLMLRLGENPFNVTFDKWWLEKIPHEDH